MKILNFGSLNIDCTMRVAEIAKPGQTIASLGFEKFPGGKGLNQSFALARAGACVYHAGLIGEDGRFLKELLDMNGVDCRFIKTIATVTGTAFIQVDCHGQNCIVLVGGANQENTREYIDQVISFFDPGDILLLQNEVNELSYMIDRAYDQKMKIVLNPSPMNEKVLSCDLSKVSIFIMNEDEGMKITGKQNANEILMGMCAQYPDAETVLTLGSDGSMYSGKGNIIYQSAIKAQAVDTTGAGDTYTGYLLAAISREEDITAAMKRASMAAAISVSRKGAASSIPDQREVTEKMEGAAE